MKIHRFPENSLPAFEEALQLQAHGFELDIRLSRDEELVVFHDPNLKRLTRVSGLVNSMKFEEISRLNLSENPEVTPVFIPSLQQVFEKTAHSAIYNIEVKPLFGKYSPIISKLRNLIHEFEVQEKVLISCFDPVFLWRWHYHEPHIPAGFLFRRFNDYSKTVCRLNFIQWLHPEVGLIHYLPALKKISKPLCFWTVNDTEQALFQIWFFFRSAV